MGIGEPKEDPAAARHNEQMSIEPITRRKLRRPNAMRPPIGFEKYRRPADTEQSARENLELVGK